MDLTITLPPELEQELARRAAREGQTLAEYARAVLERTAEEQASLPGADALEAFRRSLPRRSPANLAALARDRGAKPAAAPEALMGSVWPEDESVDEFVETVRRWRRGQG